MSRVLVIPDIHLKPWIFDEAEKVNKDSYNDIVILGDLVDDWGKGNNLDLYRETLDRAVEFGKTYEQSLWCYGNHDVSYLWDAMESGYSMMARETVIEGITKLERVVEDRYKVVGHTSVEEPFDSCGVLTLDLFSTYSDGSPYGNQKLYIVDTLTREYAETICEK